MVDKRVMAAASFEDCIVVGCRLPYGHEGTHDLSKSAELSAADAAHQRRMFNRQLRRAGVEWDRTQPNTAEALRGQLRRLGLEPMEVCFGRIAQGACQLAAGHDGPHEGIGGEKWSGPASYVEPTPEQIDAQHRIAQQLGDELLARIEGRFPVQAPSAPYPGWNFGSGASGVIE